MSSCPLTGIFKQFDKWREASAAASVTVEVYEQRVHVQIVADERVIHIWIRVPLHRDSSAYMHDLTSSSSTAAMGFV